MKPRFSYEQLIELAGDEELHRFEGKSSSFLIKSHANHRIAPSDSELRNHLRGCLSVNGGAFANARGGLIVFGFADKPMLHSEECTIPQKWGNQSIVDWVGTLLRSSLQPELGEFDCYLVAKESQPRFLVIDIAESTVAPHQSIDNKYYVRLGNSACPAEHWLIESIRNKSKGPQLTAESDSSKVKLSHVSDDLSALFEIPITIRNVGRLMAKDWALELMAKDFAEVRLNDNSFERILNSSNCERQGDLLKARHPLFPNQSLTTSVRAVAKIQWETDGKSSLKSLLIDGRPTANLEFLIYADNAPVTTCSLPIDARFLLRQGYTRLAESNKIQTWGNVLGIPDLMNK